MANINKDDKTGLYWFKISLGTDPMTGKRRQTTRRGFEKKKDAEQVYNDLKNQYYDGILTYNQSTKFKDFIEEYLKWYKNQVRITTYENRLSSIKTNITDVFGEYKLEQITPMTIQQWQQKLLGKGKDPNYVRSLHIKLSQILERAINLDIIRTNPAKKAGNIKRKKKEVQFWTEDELNKALNNIDTSNLSEYFGYILIKFLFYTGLRISELQALTWDNFNEYDKSINIVRDLNYKNKDRWDFDELKNSSSDRIVVLDDDTFDMILGWQEYQKTLFEVKEDSFIFSYDNGLPIYKSYPCRIIEKCARENNVKRIKVHALRHSHASFLISLDVNIIAVAKRLGHANVQEVLKTYGHLYPKHQFDVANNINDHIKNKTGSNVGQSTT